MTRFEPAANEFLQDSGIESGGESRQSAAVEDNAKLIVGSYNIRYAVGQFLISTGLLRKAGLNLPGHRSEIVAANLLNAAEVFKSGSLVPRLDVVALQEADKRTMRAGGHHIARDLAEHLGMSWVHAAAGIPRGRKPAPRQWWLDFEEQIALHDEGDTGVAFLGNLPLDQVKRIDLPWQECPWRPRLALAATIIKADREVRIVNCHIDPHSAVDGQMEQLEMVLEEADMSSHPVVMLGDFNTLSRYKCKETRLLLESRGFTTPIPTGTPTWRGAGIRLHADWIFVRELEVKRWGVGRPLNVSDHWPIWAEIDLG